MQKYKFSVSLQGNKHKVDVQILGFDLQDAERKLRQMYPHGEVVLRDTTTAPRNSSHTLDIAAALSIITEEYADSHDMRLAEQS